MSISLFSCSAQLMTTALPSFFPTVPLTKKTIKTNHLITVFYFALTYGAFY